MIKKPSYLQSSFLAVAIFGTALAHGAEHTFQYYRWLPAELRGDNASSIQLSEFDLMLEGLPVDWGNVTIENPGGNTPSAESPPNLIDGNLDTKWLDFNKKELIFKFDDPTKIDGYRFATANDAYERDPITWRFYGSNNGSDWILLDSIEEYETTVDRKQYETFELPDGVKPVVLSYHADVTVVYNGEPVYLDWDLEVADSAEISQGVGAVTPGVGYTMVTPQAEADTVYTLSASNEVGTISKDVVVRAVSGGEVTAKYLRFQSVKQRSVNTVQLSEFVFSHQGVPVVPVDVTNPGGRNAPDDSEGALKLIDDDVGTKWFDNNGATLVFDFGTTVTVDNYEFATANDHSDRDPVRWIIEASDDGEEWELVENMTAFDFDVPKGRFEWSQMIPFPGDSLIPAILASSSNHTIAKGQSVELRWRAGGAETVTISNGIGSVNTEGSVVVSPTEDTTYTITATSSNARSSSTEVHVVVVDPERDTIDYVNFDDAGTEISLMGDAELINDFETLPQGGDVKRLRLTPDLHSSHGAAWFRFMQPVSNGFETSFDFHFATASESGGDGMAFVVQNHADRHEALPNESHERGLASNALNISLHSYHEPDTDSAARLVVRANEDELISVDLTEIEGLNLYESTQGLDLSDVTQEGNPYRVDVHYSAGKLTVALNTIILVDGLAVNLNEIGAMNSAGEAFVGFTSRTGGVFETHDVTRWYFTSLEPGESGYEAWAAVNAPGQGIDEDYNNDGLPNGIEYFMGLNSSGFNPTPQPDEDGKITWPKGNNYDGTYGDGYRVEISTNLVDWEPVQDDDPSLEENGNSVSYQLDMSGARRFVRLVVSE